MSNARGMPCESCSGSVGASHGVTKRMRRVPNLVRGPYVNSAFGTFGGAPLMASKTHEYAQHRLQ
eukprot:3205973-Pyramimonas_sp.AAC.1